MKRNAIKAGSQNDGLVAYRTLTGAITDANN